MTDAATVHSHHESSPWPFVVGLGVLLTAIALLTTFAWGMPNVGIVMGGGVLALMAIGLAGWAREFFQHDEEQGLGPVAVVAFIVSEIIIFGTVFVAFWLSRIENFAEWGSFIPEGLEIGFALWLSIILWASSLTIVLSEKAFEKGDRSKAMIWRTMIF